DCRPPRLGSGSVKVCTALSGTALDVPPPAEDLALRHEGQSVAATGLQYRGSAASSNCLDVFEECTQLLSSLHRRRGRSIAGRAVAKLSVAIPSPGPDGAVGLERQAVGRAAGDRLHARQVAELRNFTCRGGALYLV